MKTTVQYVSVRCNLESSPLSERVNFDEPKKAVAIRDENGNLKYHMLISMLRDHVVVPDTWTLQLLLEMLEYYEKIPKEQKRVLAAKPKVVDPYAQLIDDLRLEQSELH